MGETSTAGAPCRTARVRTVVLLIHGGPFAQYTAAVLDEVQAHLDAGVAVVWSNPRGSAGRGRDWGLAVRGNFAEPAATDVLAVLDAAL